MPPEMPMGEEMPEENDDELLAELLEAAEAGDSAEGAGFFEPVPGAEQDAAAAPGAPDIDPEQLQQLLEMLQQQGDGGGMGGSGGV